MESLLDIRESYELTLNGQSYSLLEVAGRGGSSIVYKARQNGGVFKEFLIIKEFYPYKQGVRREWDGRVSFCGQSKEQTRRLMERAQRESDIVDALREDEGNNNPWFLSYSRPIETNNTLYTIIRTESGAMLSEMIGAGQIKRFPDVCRYILCVLDALAPIHKKGYLHLDVSPDNIHVSDLGIARLIDYNSAFHMSEKSDNLIFSFKEGYSAKELMEAPGPRPLRLGPATDLYSVSAIFFELIKGSPPKDIDFIIPSRFDLGDVECLRGASRLLIKKTQKLLKKGLSGLPENRFQSVGEFREAVNELLRLAQEKSLVNTHWLNPGYGRFVGREEELAQIDAMLAGRSYVYLEGMGGIGKTELAKRYAEANRKKYNSIQFVTYDGSLKSTIGAQLEFHNLDAVYYDKIYGKDTLEYMFRDKLKFLEKHDERTLIIVDGYNTDADNDFNRLVSGRYKVIFTSRNEHGANAVCIGAMASQKNLLKLFAEYYKPKEAAVEDEADIQKITDLLFGHTMAVELVAAALSKSEQTIPGVYERLKNGINPSMRTKVPVDKEGISAEERKNTIFKHIHNLFDMSEIRGNSNFEFIMVNMVIVPYTGLAVKQFYEWALSERYGGDMDEAENDINELAERRWIEFDAASRKVSLHPIVSDVVNEELKPDSVKCSQLVKGFVEYSNECKDKTFVERTIATDTLNLACKRITDVTELTADLINRYAKLCYLQAHYNEALEYQIKVANNRETLCGTKHHDTAIAYSNRGSIYKKQGNYDMALVWFQNALAIQEEILGTEHLDVAFTYDRIGSIYSIHGYYTKAFDWLIKAMVIREKVLGIVHPVTATSYNNIGIVYHKQGKFANAMEWYLKALAIQEKELESEHPETATIYSNIGSIYCDMGDYPMGLDWFQKSLIIYEKVLGNLHPATANAYRKIGIIMSSYRKDYCSAIEWDKKALNIYEKLFITRHPDIANIYNSIAENYRKQGDYTMALNWYQRALPIFEKALGREHPQIAKIYNNIALVYNGQELYCTAFEWYQKALVICEKVLGTEHPYTSKVYNNIAENFKDQGDYRTSVVWYEKALIYREKELGIGNTYTSKMYCKIGAIYYRQGNFNKALEWYQKVLNNGDKNLNSEQTLNDVAYNNIATIYYDQGDFSKAVEWYLKTLNIRESKLGTEHPDTATLYNNIGVAYSYQGNYGNALEYYQKALVIRDKLLGSENSKTATTYQNIGVAYRNLGNIDLALVYNQKALTIFQKVYGLEHVKTATVCSSIGIAYYEQGDYSKACEWHQKALAIREKKLGASHPDTIQTSDNLEKARQSLD